MNTVILIFLGIILLTIVLLLIAIRDPSNRKSIFDFDEDFINFNDDEFRKELFNNQKN